MRTTTTFLFLILSATLSFGSVRRIEISEATQTESPIKFSVTITPDEQQDGHFLGELVLPAGQQDLAELWKIHLSILQDKKTILGAPLHLSYAKDKTITVRFHGHVDTLSHCLIAIRCGKHAPSSETIYQIHVGSYLKNTAEQNGGGQVEAPSPNIQLDTDYVSWVKTCLNDFDSIEVGTTREEVESKLTKDGGLQSRVSPVRFTHPDCRLFKIDVEFKREEGDTVGKADKVTQVSKPYIERVVLD